MQRHLLVIVPEENLEDIRDGAREIYGPEDGFVYLGTGVGPVQNGPPTHFVCCFAVTPEEEARVREIKSYYEGVKLVEVDDVSKVLDLLRERGLVKTVKVGE